MAGVAVGSLVGSDSRLLQMVPSNDTILHFGSYVILGFLAYISPRRQSAGYMRAAGMVLFGIVLEFGQQFSPGRHIDMKDVVWNVLGIACGLLIGRLCIDERQYRSVP